MNINQFAKQYARSGISRFHMPGHKGVKIHGLEPFDLTEIKGADQLFEPNGIIAQSESRTSRIFGTATTCYSVEGSSLSIKAALGILRRYFGRQIKVASPRNCHRAFISACALLDIDPIWLYPDKPRTMLCECAVSAKSVEKCLESEKPDAVYITSPDYLGNMADVKGIAEVCERRGVFLICDNAHGAYLKLLEQSMHPIDLGAHIVCDSAHKTLPVYTGGAYLHISKNAPEEFEKLAKPTMLLFGSTSPSYLLLESLDLCANLLENGFGEEIKKCCKRTENVKKLMKKLGIEDLSQEPLKITIAAKSAGYSGEELAEKMRDKLMECEYSDPEAVVLMFSPYNTEEDFCRLEEFLNGLQKNGKMDEQQETAGELFNYRAEKGVSIREAMLSASKRISVDKAEGRICAESAMSCQPSVAIVMAGEKITAQTIKILKNYSIFEIDVI